MYVIKYENKQKEWHPATKPLTVVVAAGSEQNRRLPAPQVPGG
jgi:hypothetical protein